jgi:hypothetical protein
MAKFRFAVSSVETNELFLAVCVLLVGCWFDHNVLRDRYIFMFYREASPKIWIYFVIKVHNHCVILYLAV